jgi:hypothetical protein
MQIYTDETQCEVCGEIAPCTPKTACAAWFVGTRIVHHDPRICADNIKTKQEKEKALKDASDPLLFS